MFEREIGSFHNYGGHGEVGCNYARLGAYSAGFRGIRPPVPVTTVSGYYVVPSYSAPGYDTLTHGNRCCGRPRPRYAGLCDGCGRVPDECSCRRRATDSCDRCGRGSDACACSGGPYFRIGQAYGCGAENCSTRYVGSLCC